MVRVAEGPRVAVSREAPPLAQPSAPPPPDPVFARVGSTESPAIGALRRYIEKLDGEITARETSNGQKRGLAGRLRNDIAARRSEIQAELDRKQRMAMVFALFGAFGAGMVTLASAMRDDQRLGSLNQQLATAEADIARIDAEIAAYKQTKSTLTGKLAELRADETRLIERPSLGAAAGSPAALADRFLRSELLVGNLRAQIAVLVDIKSAAEKVGVSLDSLLDSLRATLAGAEQALAASRKELSELLKIALSPDPNAAAASWVEAEVRKAVESAIKPNLRGLRLPLETEGQMLSMLTDAAMRALNT